MPTCQPLAHIDEVSVYISIMLYLSDTVANNRDNVEGNVCFKDLQVPLSFGPVTLVL